MFHCIEGEALEGKWLRMSYGVTADAAVRRFTESFAEKKTWKRIWVDGKRYLPVDERRYS